MRPPIQPHNLVLRIAAKMLIPPILMFALYVQFHGEYGPGGGFQAGAIIAAAFILYALLEGERRALDVLPQRALLGLIAVGPLIYVAVGIAGTGASRGGSGAVAVTVDGVVDGGVVAIVAGVARLVGDGGIRIITIHVGTEAIAVGVLEPGAQAPGLPVVGAAELALEAAGGGGDDRIEVVGHPVGVVAVVELDRGLGRELERDVGAVRLGVLTVVLVPGVVERRLVLPHAGGDGERRLRFAFAEVDPNPNELNLTAGLEVYRAGGHDGVVLRLRDIHAAASGQCGDAVQPVGLGRAHRAQEAVDPVACCAVHAIRIIAEPGDGEPRPGRQRNDAVVDVGCGGRRLQVADVVGAHEKHVPFLLGKSHWINVLHPDREFQIGPADQGAGKQRAAFLPTG